MSQRLLITGAEGFVGSWLVPAALASGWEVVAGVMPGSSGVAASRVVEADITTEQGITALAGTRPDAVVHLAALASGAAARRDPELATRVNATATERLMDALTAGGRSPRILYVSTGEVYGGGHGGPIREAAPVAPQSPYAESKAAAERAVARFGDAVMVARPFTHSGPGQSADYVLPGFAARIRAARDQGRREVVVGNLAPVRDFLDVRDVVRAYLLLLEHGTTGTVCNVASGVGQSLQAVFERLAAILGADVVPVVDASLVRPADIPILIGDATRLREATGWAPSIEFDQTLRDICNAQEN